MGLFSGNDDEDYDRVELVDADGTKHRYTRKEYLGLSPFKRSIALAGDNVRFFKGTQKVDPDVVFGLKKT
ncbi:MAG: hypothetical protein WA001_01050 [Patescibacteria group bacterium]